jgi:hypothetical protein
MAVRDVLPADPGQKQRERSHAHEMPEKSAQQHNGLSCQATIRKGLQGYTVTLTMRQNGTARVLVDKVVESYAEAETVARAFAAQQGYPWHKVAVVSK